MFRSARKICTTWSWAVCWTCRRIPKQFLTSQRGEAKLTSQPLTCSATCGGKRNRTLACFANRLAPLQVGWFEVLWFYFSFDLFLKKVGRFWHKFKHFQQPPLILIGSHFSDAQKPLMGNFQENQGIISLPAQCPSQSIVDVSENMRAKLYALFCKIGESLHLCALYSSIFAILMCWS